MKGGPGSRRMLEINSVAKLHLRTLLRCCSGARGALLALPEASAPSWPLSGPGVFQVCVSRGALLALHRNRLEGPEIHRLSRSMASIMRILRFTGARVTDRDEGKQTEPL